MTDKKSPAIIMLNDSELGGPCFLNPFTGDKQRYVSHEQMNTCIMIAAADKIDLLEERILKMGEDIATMIRFAQTAEDASSIEPAPTPREYPTWRILNRVPSSHLPSYELNGQKCKAIKVSDVSQLAGDKIRLYEGTSSHFRRPCIALTDKQYAAIKEAARGRPITGKVLVFLDGGGSFQIWQENDFISTWKLVNFPSASDPDLEKALDEKAQSEYAGAKNMHGADPKGEPKVTLREEERSNITEEELSKLYAKPQPVASAIDRYALRIGFDTGLDAYLRARSERRNG